MAIAADSLVTVARGAVPMIGLNKVGMVEVEIDLTTVSAELVADGEGVLATGDVIQCLSFTKGTTILSAGVQVTETVAGVAALPIELGTDVDTDQFMTSVDIGSGTSYVAGDYITMAGDLTPEVIGQGAGGAATNTLDITCGTVSGTTITAGKIRVWAIVIDSAPLDGGTV